MPVISLPNMSPLAAPHFPIRSFRSQSPCFQGASVLNYEEHGPLLAPRPTVVCCMEEHFLSMRTVLWDRWSPTFWWAGLCVNQEGWRKTSSSLPSLSAALWGSRRAKAFSANLPAITELSLCWDAGSGLCLSLGCLFFIWDFRLH